MVDNLANTPRPSPLTSHLPPQPIPHNHTPTPHSPTPNTQQIPASNAITRSPDKRTHSGPSGQTVKRRWREADNGRPHPGDKRPHGARREAGKTAKSGRLLSGTRVVKILPLSKFFSVSFLSSPLLPSFICLSLRSFKSFAFHSLHLPALLSPLFHFSHLLPSLPSPLLLSPISSSPLPLPTLPPSPLSPLSSTLPFLPSFPFPSLSLPPLLSPLPSSPSSSPLSPLHLLPSLLPPTLPLLPFFPSATPPSLSLPPPSFLLFFHSASLSLPPPSTLFSPPSSFTSPLSLLSLPPFLLLFFHPSLPSPSLHQRVDSGQCVTQKDLELWPKVIMDPSPPFVPLHPPLLVSLWHIRDDLPDPSWRLTLLGCSGIKVLFSDVTRKRIMQSKGDRSPFGIVSVMGLFPSPPFPLSLSSPLTPPPLSFPLSPPPLSTSSPPSFPLSPSPLSFLPPTLLPLLPPLPLLPSLLPPSHPPSPLPFPLSSSSPLSPSFHFPPFS
ncbi:hypothetical protein C7M84_003511 [Penaeus vannamei]|uniref:Uncharacterized protein n=1 Tax=Penaeus vannamei TaxID=6689 RepID=A0A423TMW4_PENVA|nr:hypothetical protein C7M84_003511 [Penaeus vannamei]